VFTSYSIYLLLSFIAFSFIAFLLFKKQLNNFRD